MGLRTQACLGAVQLTIPLVCLLSFLCYAGESQEATYSFPNSYETAETAPLHISIRADKDGRIREILNSQGKELSQRLQNIQDLEKFIKGLPPNSSISVNFNTRSIGDEAQLRFGTTLIPIAELTDLCETHGVHFKTSEYHVEAGRRRVFVFYEAMDPRIALRDPDQPQRRKV